MAAPRMGRAMRCLVAGAAGAALLSPAAIAAADAGSKDKLFDPEGLERGAKALKEIGASPFAKQALALSREQEVTKQQELKKEEAKFAAQAAQAAQEQERVRWESQSKFAQEEAQRKAQLAQYQDELARQRQAHEHDLQRKRNAELVQLQADSARQQEEARLRVEQQIQAERRAGEQYKAELEKEVQRAKALAEAEGRAKENRENEDVNRRAALLKYQEETRKALESINAVMSHLGQAALSLVTDRDKVVMLVAGGSALALGVYGAREGARVAGRAAERWLGTPKLVRETSRWALTGSGPRAPAFKSGEAVKRDFSDIVLREGLHDQVRSLAAAAANTKRHGAPFRHMLFYGPPGTGKTLVAKRLARTSGLDYAILSGGDVAPLEGAAVTQLHSTFDWAERSRKGLLLFIDEADAFLGRRSDAMSEGLRGALNALLYRTGDQSRDFMVVLATNRPGDLDDAVLDRMDEALEFGLPGAPQRKELLELYIDRYITKAGTAEGGAGTGAGGPLQRLSGLLRGRKAAADRIEVEGIDDKTLAGAAEAMDGFSAREIAKFAASLQAAVYGGEAARLTPDLFARVLRHKLREHAARRAFVLGHHGAGGAGGGNGGAQAGG